jgi:ligand-binding sensor domain-containing protein
MLYIFTLMTKTLFLLTFLLSATPFQVRSQSTSYRHEVIGTRDGLNSSKVFALHQDQRKQLWIGTEHGISRYNGYDFLNFQYTEKQMQIGRVLAISSDKHGGLWIGGDKGLFYFSQGSMRQLQFADKPGYVIETLVTDSAGNIWIGGFDGIYKINANETAAYFEKRQLEVSQDHKLNFNLRVFSLATDRLQNIYVATSYAIYIIRKNSRQPLPVWTNPNPYNYIRSVAACSPDSIYWNLYDSHPMRLLHGVLDSMPDSRFVGRNVFVHNNIPYALTTSCVAEINGNKINPLVYHENISNLVYASIIDAEGNIWLGSWEGLIKYKRTPFHLYQLQHPLNTDAFSFFENNQAELLIGGNRGRIFVLKDNAIVPHPGFPLLFEKAEVMSIYQHQDDSYWFGSGYQGIARFSNKKLRKWNGRTDELQNNNCEAIFSAGNGKLFACTEKGVTIIDPSKENSIESYLPFKNNYAIFPELFGGIQPAQQQWFFYGSQGLYRLRNGQLENDTIQGFHFPALYINKIIRDKKGFFWMATLGHGILKCSFTNNNWKLVKQYYKANGLSSNDILSVLCDKNDNIWAADYMSLCMIRNKPDDELLIQYNENDGLLRSYYQTLKLDQQKNGTIWGITTMGVFSFHPDSINRNTLAPSLMMDSILVTSTDDASSSIVTDLGGKSTFKYFQNSLQFNFTAIGLTDPEKIRYAYRLVQLDTNWIFTDTRSVNFRFLQPGTYDFELKASNNNDVWTAVPLKYSFTIVPPFWKTTWFVVLMFTTAVLLIFALFRRRLKDVRRKAAIRQQVAELEGKALRAQMNPHFIFNSLNAIQECIVSGKVDAAYDYLARFSKLLRMVLNNSEKDLVTLQEELDMLNIYLQLESLRFKDSFTYEIKVAPNIETEMSEVPPLLLQPYIENAIWHGLIHKEGEKKLSIACEEHNGILFCTITDNGIGRTKSAAIKASKLGADKFESKGMVLSEQRIRMMNLQIERKYKVSVSDIYDEAGQVCGTNVTLELPQTNQ